MRSRLFFYASAVLLSCSTLLLLVTQDAAQLWPFWPITVVLVFVSLPFYVNARYNKKNQYQIDEIKTITQAYDDKDKN